MGAQDFGEGFFEVRAKRFGHDEPGDVVGGVDHPVTLAPPCGAGGPFFFGFLAPRLRLKAFHVSDGLFEDMAQNGDRHFGREVIVAKGLEPLADVIGQGQAVDRVVLAKQAPVVAGDFKGITALVDGVKQTPEIVPDRAGVVGVTGDKGL